MTQEELQRKLSFEECAQHAVDSVAFLYEYRTVSASFYNHVSFYNRVNLLCAFV
ncbi:hypothetical protein LSAT2_032168, partial [Lamellibrachia satsuma]